MDFASIYNFFTNYGGVVIGVAFLILGSMVLPSGVRKYVLTAGIAIAIFRTFQIANGNKRTAKADAERKRLKGELEKLTAQVNLSSEKQDELNKRAAKIKQDQEDLKAKAAALESASDAASEQKEKLDKETREMQARHEALLKDTSENETVQRLIRNAQEAIQDLERSQ
jgi:septal ring factor EnvC (AmiA/AmiB activator)